MTTVTGAAGGVADIMRDVSAKTMLQDAPELYKSTPVYDEQGRIVDYNKELSDYGKLVNSGKVNDPAGRLVIGLNAYDQYTNEDKANNPLPHTFLGNTATGAIDVAPDIAITALLPEEKLLEGASTINKIKSAVWNPFTKLMGTEGFLKGYSQAKQKGATPGEATVSAMEEGGDKAFDGAMMGLLSGVSGKVIAPAIYNNLVRGGIIAGGKITDSGIRALTAASVFGAYPVAKDILMGKPINMDEAESSAGMGILFGGIDAVKRYGEWRDVEKKINNVWADRYTMAVNNFMNASDEAMDQVHDLKTNDSDLFGMAVDHAAKAKTSTILEEKQDHIAAASTFAKMADLKGTIDVILHDPVNFLLNIKNSDMPYDQKVALMNKAYQVFRKYHAGFYDDPKLLNDVTEAARPPKQPRQPAPSAPEPDQPEAPQGAPQAAQPTQPAAPTQQSPEMDDFDAELDAFTNELKTEPEPTPPVEVKTPTPAPGVVPEPPQGEIANTPENKEETDNAVSKQSPDEVGVRQQGAMGEKVGAGDTGPEAPTPAQTKSPEVQSDAEGKQEVKKPENKYYIAKRNQDSEIIHEEVEAKPYKNDYGLDLFTRKADDGRYEISEGSTGLLLAWGDTPEQAAQRLTENPIIKGKTPAETQKIIKSQYENNGVKSPRGIVKPEVEKPNYYKDVKNQTLTIKQEDELAKNNPEYADLFKQDEDGTIDEAGRDRMSQIYKDEVARVNSGKPEQSTQKPKGPQEESIGNFKGGAPYKLVGKNAAGEKIYENPDGIRARRDPGGAVTEETPGQQRKDEFKITEEQQQQTPPKEEQNQQAPPKEEPKAEREQTEQEKRQAERDKKKAKIKADIKDALKDFSDFGRKHANSLINPEYLAKGLKVIGLYAKAGILDFQDIAEDIANEMGEDLRNIWDALKSAYGAYRDGEATDEEVDQMTDSRQVRKLNVDDFLPKKQENGSTNGRQPMEGDSSELPPGQLSGTPDDAVQGKQTEKVSGRPDDNGGQDGNVAKGQTSKPKPGPGGTADNGEASGTTGGNKRKGGPAGDTGTGVSKNAQTRTLKPEDQNHVIEKGDQIGQGTNLEKFNNNMDAIFLLKKLEKEDRNPIPEEKKLLAKFVGWGGLADYLRGPSEYHINDAINAAMHGLRTVVRPNRWENKVLDFSANGPIDVASYSSFSDLANDIKSKLNNSGLPVGIDDVRKSLVRQLLTGSELNDASNSTINAHYTERQVIDKMWDLAKQLGFKEGNVLESSAGIGNFFGLIPKDLRENTKLTGYELDSITGRMLKKLYPEAKITVEGFEKANVKPNSQDLVIGNVPFAQKAPFDKNYPELSKFNMHNYFIGKSMRLLKPGGIAMVITSKSTMDGDVKFREWMASPEGGNSVLVGAIRLPNNAFSGNAGTQVTTDIVVFQKRPDKSNALHEDIPFRYTYPLDEKHYDKEGNEVPIHVNEYYHEHPENMLGKMMTAHEAGSGGLYGNADSTLHAPEGYNFISNLNKAVKSFPENVMQQERIERNNDEAAQNIQAVDKKEGSMFEKDGKIYLVKDGEGVPQTNLTPAQVKTAKAYVGLKKALLDLIKQELSVEPTEDIEGLRKELNKQYDDFVKKNNPIYRNRSLSFIEDNDVDFPLVQSLEEAKDKFIEDGKGGGKKVTEIKKSALFDKRINYPRVEPTTADNIADAIKISFNYRNGLDLNYMSSLLDMPVQEVKETLLNENLAFENPTSGLLENPEEYLSGYVRDKLDEAMSAADNDPKFQRNVDELKKVVPKDLPSSLIQYALGATWVPNTVYEDFTKELLGVDAKIIYKEALGKWDLTSKGGASNSKNTTTFAGGGKSGIQLLENELNNIQTTVFEPKDMGGRVDPKATEEARERQSQIREEFTNFMRSNRNAQELTEPIYNKIFNNFVERKWTVPDIDYYPGQTKTIKLYDEQKRSVARGLVESTLGAQEVGFGKTFVQQVMAMEAKRLGLAKKTLMVVQNATLGQYVTSFRRLYPTAKILAPSKSDFSAENRAKLYAKISTQDWDAIVMPHSQFDMIPDNPERKKAYIQEQIDAIKKAIAEADSEDKKALEAKYRDLDYELRLVDDPDALKKNAKGEFIEKKKKTNVKNEAKKTLSTTAKMEKLLNRRTDKAAMYFEDMGIDNLILDEAHDYKKLGFNTSLTNIKGIDQQASKRAQSLYLKTRHIQEKTGGRNVNFFTGTPISNTMAEVWTWMRFIRPEMVQKLGIETFDQFVNTFGVIADDIEFTATGQFKTVNRFRSFKNAPELLTAFRSIAHVVTKDDVKELVDAGSIPKMLNDKESLQIVQLTQPVKDILENIISQLRAWNNLPGDVKNTGRNKSTPLVLYGQAKVASIDPRMYDPDALDHPDSKVNAMIRRVIQKYKDYTKNKGTQMIFSDRMNSISGDRQYMDEDGQFLNPAYGKKRFELFDDIKKKLIAAGIPENEIAIVTDPKYDKQERKEALFELVQEGKVRIVIGSTQKMGVGVNAQNKMVGIEHLDVPNRPMENEQRNGRGLRPGNENKIIEISNNGMEGTADTQAYGVLAFKKKFINQLMKHGTTDRVVDDAAGEDVPTYDEMMARLSGSTYAIEKIKVDADIKREKTKRDIFNGRVIQAKRDLQYAQSNLNRDISALRGDEYNAEKVEQSFPGGEVLKVEIPGKLATDEKLGAEIDEYIEKLTKKYYESPTKYATGEININDTPVQMTLHEGIGGPVLEYSVLPFGIKDPYHHGKGIMVPSGKGVGMLSSLRSKLQDVIDQPAETKERIKRTETNIQQLQTDIDQKFDDTRLKELERRSDNLKDLMIAEGEEKEKAAKSAKDYILDQSNIKPALDFLNKAKTNTGNKMMGMLLPIPPAVWNAAIDVMKGVLKATNSAQKAVRVAAKYVSQKTGDQAMASDFEQSMNDKLANSKIGQVATRPDEPMEEDEARGKVAELQTKLRQRMSEMSPDLQQFSMLPVDMMTQKDLDKYLELAAMASVDPDHVTTDDIEDVAKPVKERILAKAIKDINDGAQPPGKPPVNTTSPGSEEDDSFKKGSFKTKVKRAMDEIMLDQGEGTSPGEPLTGKRFYSLYGKIKDVYVRNLEQLRMYAKKQASMATVDAMIKLASTKAEVRTTMAIANVRISKLIGEAGYTALREALMESNLRGAKQRWLSFEDHIKTASDNDLVDLFEDGKDSKFYSILQSIEGYEDDENPAQTILTLISNEDYDNARMYMSEMFHNAAANVAYFGKLSNGKTFDEMVEFKDGKYQFSDPKFEEAHQLYKQHIETPFKVNHAENRGVFNDSLGPLNTYYPMSPVGEDAHRIIMPSKNLYNVPDNPSNFFRTGQGDLYTQELSAMGKKMFAAFKSNNKAAAIKAIADAGLLRSVSEAVYTEFNSHEKGYVMQINGVNTMATIVRYIDSKTVINDGKSFHTTTKYLAIPDWLYSEIKPIIEKEDIGDKDDFNVIGKIMNASVNFALGGPAEAIGHSYRLLSGVINSMPYMQEWAYQNGVLGHAGGLILNNPFVKLFAGFGKILFTNPTTEDFYNAVQEMAKIGLIPEKTWSHTWSQAFAKSQGIEATQFMIPYRDLLDGNFKKAFTETRWFDFSPLLYGEHGFDLKARVTLFRLAKAMNPNATPAELFKMNDVLGQYTQALQSTLEKQIKRSGFGPYATFNRAFWRAGIRNLTMSNPLPMENPFVEFAKTGKIDPEKAFKFSYYKLVQILGGSALAMVGYWFAVNYMLNGQFPDKDTDLMKVKIPKSWHNNEFIKKYYYNQRTGQYDDMNLGFFNLVADRGMKATGVYKGYQTWRLGGTAGQISEAMQVQALNTYISQFTSAPPLSIGFRTFSGDAPYISSMHSFRGTGESSFIYKSKTQEPGMQLLGNFAGAITDVNSTLEAANPFTGAFDSDYNKDDYEGGRLVKTLLNMGLPNLFTPSIDDAKKAKFLKDNAKAIETTIKKEKKQKNKHSIKDEQ